jgi:hypothetical protein
MLTFTSTIVCPKWSNSSKSIAKMIKQSFGPNWKRAIMLRNRWIGWSRKQQNSAQS